MYTPAAQTEICNWFEARADMPPSATRQSDLQWLQESIAARRVKGVIDDVMEGDMAPTMATIRAVWQRLHGKKETVNAECPECHGTGFQIVIRRGIEGARRCPRECGVPANEFRKPEGKREEVPNNPILAELLAGIRGRKQGIKPSA